MLLAFPILPKMQAKCCVNLIGPVSVIVIQVLDGNTFVVDTEI